jgi:AbrB family looped-hinge helix DNA binding protein
MKLFYTLTRKGQLTLPQDIRAKLGLKPGSRVSITVDEATHTVQLQPVKDIVDLAGTIKTDTPLDLKQLRDKGTRHDAQP